MALFGPDRSNSACPLTRAKRTSRLRGPNSESDPGCVKTRTSRECAELFSQILSSDRCCQCNWFLHRRNREGSSTRKSSLRVFTQPRPISEVGLHHRPKLIATGFRSFVSGKRLCFSTYRAHRSLGALWNDAHSSRCSGRRLHGRSRCRRSSHGSSIVSPSFIQGFPQTSSRQPPDRSGCGGSSIRWTG